MSHSKPINTLLLDMMISSKNDYVFIRDLNYLTAQITFGGWWICKNVDLKLSIAWDDSRHAPSGGFYLHCGLEETGSPGIIYIICHQVFVIHHNMVPA
jgi:hypothetical protein